MTPHMNATECAQAFNASAERSNWKAYVGGQRTMPTVIFKSTTAMVELTYYTTTNTFAVVFQKATCAFGDFMASTHKSLLVILSALKATGYPVAAPIEADEGVLRIQYDPRTKTVFVALVAPDDDWQDYAPTPATRNLREDVTHSIMHAARLQMEQADELEEAVAENQAVLEQIDAELENTD